MPPPKVGTPTTIRRAIDHRSRNDVLSKTLNSRHAKEYYTMTIFPVKATGIRRIRSLVILLLQRLHKCGLKAGE